MLTSLRLITILVFVSGPAEGDLLIWLEKLGLTSSQPFCTFHDEDTMGGHGGLNILPQKSWHVYNFDNREKVKEDEEKEAARIEQERLEQQHRDAEIRRNLLLDRAKDRRASGSFKGQAGKEPKALEAPVQVEEDEDCDKRIVSVASPAPPAHINLFQDMVPVGDATRGVAHKSFRPTVPVEPKAEDVKYSLGYGAVSEKGEKPWYLTKRVTVPDTEDNVRSKKRSKGGECLTLFQDRVSPL